MDAQARLDDLIARINGYLKVKHLAPDTLNQDFIRADSLPLADMDRLTQDDCFNHAYQLCQYADHIGFERAELETITRWCENSLNSIISSEIDDMSGEYLKYEIKVARIIKHNDLAEKINEWLLLAQGRLEPLKNREYNVRKKADILIEKGKRK